jgi:hypothetical protein
MPNSLLYLRALADCWETLGKKNLKRARLAFDDLESDSYTWQRAAGDSFGLVNDLAHSFWPIAPTQPGPKSAAKQRK